jgi:hypothetical protein
MERMSKYTKGEDCFSPDVGQPPPKDTCRTCKTFLEKTHANQDGATGIMEAMARRSHLHDVWACPYAGEDWHDQLTALRKEIRQTASARLQKMLEEEAAEIVATRKPTKTEYKSVFWGI